MDEDRRSIDGFIKNIFFAPPNTKRRPDDDATPPPTMPFIVIPTYEVSCPPPATATLPADVVVDVVFAIATKDDDDDYPSSQ